MSYNKKSTVSRQSISKTNYLKTNLLKQIKKISIFLWSLIYIFETFLFLGAKLVSFSTPYKYLYAKSIPFLTYINASVCIFYQTPAFDNLGLQIDTISTFFHTFTLYRLIFIIQSLAWWCLQSGLLTCHRLWWRGRSCVCRSGRCLHTWWHSSRASRQFSW